MVLALESDHLGLTFWVVTDGRFDCSLIYMVERCNIQFLKLDTSRHAKITDKVNNLRLVVVALLHGTELYCLNQPYVMQPLIGLTRNKSPSFVLESTGKFQFPKIAKSFIRDYT